MMECKHIHIKGLVQGVGFRPHVYALASQLKLNGYVNNSSDGVHIVIGGPRKQTEQFLQQLQSHPPEAFSDHASRGTGYSSATF